MYGLFKYYNYFFIYLYEKIKMHWLSNTVIKKKI